MKRRVSEDMVLGKKERKLGNPKVGWGVSDIQCRLVGRNHVLARESDAESREEDKDDDGKELHVDEECLCVLAALHFVEVAEVFKLVDGHGTGGGDETAREDDTDSDSGDAVDTGCLLREFEAGLHQASDEGDDSEEKEAGSCIHKGVGLDVLAVAEENNGKRAKEEELKSRPDDTAETSTGAGGLACGGALDLVGLVDAALNEGGSF